MACRSSACCCSCTRPWHTFDPRSGERGGPQDLVVLGCGDQPYLVHQGGRSASVQWSVRRNEEAALNAALERGRILSRELIDFSLFSLPLETQELYRVRFDPAQSTGTNLKALHRVLRTPTF